MIDQSV